MTHLIDKATLVAEINKRIIDAPVNNIGHQRVWAYNDVKDIINTIEVKEVEVKEVDLENEIILWANAIPEIRLDDIERLAEHFFELGLKTER